MIRNYVLLLSFCIAACFSCKKSDTVKDRPVNVYVAGYEFDKGNMFARYWKNGASVPLTGSSGRGRVLAITVSRGDVYMAGHEQVVVGSEVFSVAKYWKNGRSVALSDSLHNNYASSLAVVGSNVYVAGHQYTGLPFTGRSVAKYWKNGIPFILNDSSKNAAAYSIAVSGKDVYVAGFESTGRKDLSRYDSTVAKYWKTVFLLSSVNHPSLQPQRRLLYQELMYMLQDMYIRIPNTGETATPCSLIAMCIAT